MRMVVMVVTGVIMIVVVRVAMAMAAENEETNKVGEQSCGTNNEDELGVLNLGRVDESSEGFKDDGDAKGDEKDGIEECSENLGANPLCDD